MYIALAAACIMMSSGALSSTDKAEKKGVNSSRLRDSFNCHILLCPQQPANTISLNNLVLCVCFPGGNVLRSTLFIFAYLLVACDEKNNRLCAS